jgi:hypothetical protein
VLFALNTFKPSKNSLLYGVHENRTPYGVAPESLIESKNQPEGQISFDSYFYIGCDEYRTAYGVATEA